MAVCPVHILLQCLFYRAMFFVVFAVPDMFFRRIIYIVLLHNSFIRATMNVRNSVSVTYLLQQYPETILTSEY